jgi:hypothetical protein
MEVEWISRLNETLRYLIGQKISSVQYATIDYFDDKPCWDFGKIHQVEHGVEFTIESGEVYRISWDDYENDYGVYIAKKESMSFWEEVVMWNVAEREEWENLLNQEIIEIKTYWHEWNSEVTLQVVEFEFINGKKIWFIAARFDEKKDQLLTTSDDICIIFEEPITFKYKVGNYTNDKSLKIEIYKK